MAQEAGEYGDAARMLYASIMQASRALQHGALHSERNFAARFKPPASLYFLKKTGCGLSRRGWQLFPSGGHAALPRQ